jgi:hypothetical protein
MMMKWFVYLTVLLFSTQAHAEQQIEQGPLEWGTCYFVLHRFEHKVIKYEYNNWDVKSDWKNQSQKSASITAINKNDVKVTIKVSCTGGQFIVERNW